MLKKIESLLDKNEIHRLKKAAKDNNIAKLHDWAMQLEYQLSQQYEKVFQEELEDSIDNFILTIVYTLHFNESTRFGKKRVSEFMDDLLETIDMFKRGEAKPNDYKEQLKKDGIIYKGRND